jgi:hypothetical protein
MDLASEFEKADTTQGVYHLSGGEIGYTNAIKNEDGTFDVRYESGWYCTYTNDGILPVAGVIYKLDGTTEDVPGGDKRNIVLFEPMTWKQAKEKYPTLRDGFPP